ncbi:MAG: hypothetical protein ACYTFI_05100, partial [Planctomycetota bacterium]
MRRVAVVVTVTILGGCSAPTPEKREADALSALKSALGNAGTLAEQVRLRREICSFGPAGREFLVDAVADPGLHRKTVTARADLSFHVSIINGLTFRFKDEAGGNEGELADLNARLDRRLLTDEGYLRSFIETWGPGNAVSREE